MQATFKKDKKDESFFEKIGTLARKKKVKEGNRMVHQLKWFWGSKIECVERNRLMICRFLVRLTLPYLAFLQMGPHKIKTNHNRPGNEKFGQFE